MHWTRTKHKYDYPACPVKCEVWDVWNVFDIEKNTGAKLVLQDLMRDVLNRAVYGGQSTCTKK
jgi:hypothetical protein